MFWIVLWSALSLIAPQRIMDCTTPGRLQPENCDTPVATYVTETPAGWQIEVWQDEALIVYETAEFVPDQTELLAMADDGDGQVLLYQLASGEYAVFAGPTVTGRMYSLLFTLPPDGAEYRQDFIIAG